MKIIAKLLGKLQKKKLENLKSFMKFVPVLRINKTSITYNNLIVDKINDF